MNPTLEIFSQGEEIVTGQTVDTNAAWIAQECVAMGFTVKRHTTAGDKLDELIALLKEIAPRSDCCICTGGLGPTSDDLTADAVAKAFSMPLRFDPIAFEQIKDFFERRNRIMPEINRKQAYFPDGATRIDNHWGTAPGFELQYDRCRFFFLPGVPYEMRHLFDAYIKKMLEEYYALQPKLLVSIKTVGLGESDIQTAIADMVLPPEIQLGFRAGPDHIETKLLFPAGYPKHEIDTWINRTRSRIGDYVFGIDGAEQSCKNLPGTIDTLMRDRRQTAIFIETISQGLIAAKCATECNWLLESYYAQSKERLAEKFSTRFDPKAPIEFAKTIAAIAKQNSGTDFVLVQLYEPMIGSLNAPDSIITLYNILLCPDGFRHTTHTIGGPFKRKQNQAALLSLDLLRRYLQNLI